MASPANEIATYLDGLSGAPASLAATTGWALCIAMEADEPETVVTIYDTGGEGQEQEGEFRPTIQVRTRAHDYDAAYAKQIEIRDILIAAGDIPTITAVWLQSQPQAIGTDDGDRFLLTANYRCMLST